MASGKEEAAGAAWQGADLERPLTGEDPESDSLAEALRWIGVYHQLVHLEQQLLDTLAQTIPGMPEAARKEAEETNLPVLASQVERFRHRLAYWQRKRDQLEGRSQPPPPDLPSRQ